MNMLVLTIIPVLLTQPQYFKAEEYSTIAQAATMNACKGDDFVILLAIRKAENGRPGLEFGIMHPKAKNTNLRIQAGWAACTIIKNRQRWKDSGRKVPFIQFLGARYCPAGAENDPDGLNQHWVKNVTHWYQKLKR